MEESTKNLVEAASEYRQAEREAHLRLEDACAQLAQWGEGFGVEGDDAPLHEDVQLVLDLTRGTITPILRALETLRAGHDGAAVVEAAEARRADTELPPLFIGGGAGVEGTLLAFPGARGALEAMVREAPVDAVREYVFAAAGRAGDGPGGLDLGPILDVVGELVSEAFERYHRELLRVLREEGSRR